ncbi:hypothetical protein V8G54_012161 [Vigna mungo]|uniref:Uncharacterized protein n=1 Tax=Vigna mungo TaxID=3915 RepID=A0AAQ3NQL0_VIGMU
MNVGLYFELDVNVFVELCRFIVIGYKFCKLQIVCIVQCPSVITEGQNLSVTVSDNGFPTEYGLSAFGNVSVKLNTEGFCPSFNAAIRRCEFGGVDVDGGSLLGGALPFLTLCSEWFVGLKREVVALRWYEAVAVADAVGFAVVAGLRVGPCECWDSGGGCWGLADVGLVTWFEIGPWMLLSKMSKQRRRQREDVCCGISLESCSGASVGSGPIGEKVVVGVGLEVKLGFQTTKGIWMARCNSIEPCTLVMDLEGTDGRELQQLVSGRRLDVEPVFGLQVFGAVLVLLEQPKARCNRNSGITEGFCPSVITESFCSSVITEGKKPSVNVCDKGFTDAVGNGSLLTASGVFRGILAFDKSLHYWY